MKLVQIFYIVLFLWDVMICRFTKRVSPFSLVIEWNKNFLLLHHIICGYCKSERKEKRKVYDMELGISRKFPFLLKISWNQRNEKKLRDGVLTGWFFTMKRRQGKNFLFALSLYFVSISKFFDPSPKFSYRFLKRI